MFELSMAIVNMGKAECTPERVLQLHKDNQVYFSQAGYEAGYEDKLITRDKKWLFLIPTEKFCDFKIASPDAIFYPADPEHSNMLWDEIKAVKDELTSLFDSFIDGQVPSSRFDELCDEFSIKFKVFENKTNPWQPNIKPSDDGIATFFEYVLCHEILFKFLSSEGEQFKRIRRCPECGKYFFAEDSRKIFCSSQCKGNNFYRLKMKK